MTRINAVRKSSLHYLTKGLHYNIVDVHTLEPRKISHPIPYGTGDTFHGFPAYLHGFENYYDKGSCYWHLKQKYRENRPQYTIEITPVAYDIVLTPLGEDAVQKRFKQHQQLAQRYGVFLNQ